MLGEANSIREGGVALGDAMALVGEATTVVVAVAEGVLVPGALLGVLKGRGICGDGDA